MEKPTELDFVTSTISDGNMSFNFGDNEEALRNREKFCADNNLDYKKTICMHCSHGAEIVVVNSSNHKGHQGADTEESMLRAEVLVTQETNLSLMLLTADCLPTLLYDQNTKTIALCHFSRQTIAANLPKKTVAWLQANLGVNPANLQVFVGPYIHKVSYGFPLPLPEPPQNLTAYVSNVNGHAYIDLAAAHNNLLIEAGVSEKNINLSEIDTFASTDHFSHYESVRNDEKPHGRLATVARIKE